MELKSKDPNSSEFDCVAILGSKLGNKHAGNQWGNTRLALKNFFQFVFAAPASLRAPVNEYEWWGTALLMVHNCGLGPDDLAASASRISWQAASANVSLDGSSASLGNWEREYRAHYKQQQLLQEQAEQQAAQELVWGQAQAADSGAPMEMEMEVAPKVAPEASPLQQPLGPLDPATGEPLTHGGSLGWFGGAGQAPAEHALASAKRTHDEDDCATKRLRRFGNYENRKGARMWS